VNKIKKATEPGPVYEKLLKMVEEKKKASESNVIVKTDKDNPPK